MTLRFYSSLDTGAPILPSDWSRRLVDNLRDVLTACLVYGYGAKAPAGWTLGHNHADGFSLTNGEGVLNLVDAGAGENYSVYVYLMDAITDGSTALAAGLNRRSGFWTDATTNGYRHSLRCPGFYATQGNKWWAVVADEKTFILSFGGNTTSASDSIGNHALFYAGRFYPMAGGAGFAAIGGFVYLGTAHLARFFEPGTPVGTCLRNPRTGLIDQGEARYFASAPTVMSRSATVNRDSPVPIAMLSRSMLLGYGSMITGSTDSSTAVVCGMLRGVLTDQIASELYLDKMLRAYGVASPNYLSRAAPLDLGGKMVLPVQAVDFDKAALVSLDPADWEPLWMS